MDKGEFLPGFVLTYWCLGTVPGSETVTVLHPKLACVAVLRPHHPSKEDFIGVRSFFLAVIEQIHACRVRNKHENKPMRLRVIKVGANLCQQRSFPCQSKIHRQRHKLWAADFWARAFS